MSLEEKLSKLREGSKEKIPEETYQKMQRAVEELRESGITERALDVGDRMPSFSLPNTDGETVSSDELLQKGPLVVSFYRGFW